MEYNLPKRRIIVDTEEMPHDLLLDDVMAGKRWEFEVPGSSEIIGVTFDSKYCSINVTYMYEDGIPGAGCESKISITICRPQLGTGAYVEPGDSYLGRYVRGESNYPLQNEWYIFGCIINGG